MELVHQMYIAYYQRPAGPDGLEYWNTQIEANGWPAVAAAFAGAPESQALYGDSSVADKVAGIYQSVFGREPEANAFSYWTEYAADNGVENLAFAIVNGAQNEDLGILNNKVAFAKEFVAQIAAGDIAYTNPEAGRELLVGIDADTEVTPAYVEAAIAGSTDLGDDPVDVTQNFGIIQETPDTDTTGYDSSYNNILNDALTLPDAQAGVLESNQVQQAYLHIDPGEDFEFDHDTFILSDLNIGTDYRIKITPDDPSHFQSNKMADVYDPSGDWEDGIMNYTDGFFDGSLYSDTFTAQEDGDHYLGLSMRWDADYGEYADGPEPYNIELLEVSSTSNADVNTDNQQIKILGVSNEDFQNEIELA